MEGTILSALARKNGARGKTIYTWCNKWKQSLNSAAWRCNV
ncbi:hypothetical protein SAMN05518865_104342 [Duganella sp. CF458]|nr:hypothetical protein SAMN05518865_104342 [Duganella sp. CF458]